MINILEGVNELKRTDPLDPITSDNKNNAESRSLQKALAQEERRKKHADADVEADRLLRENRGLQALHQKHIKSLGNIKNATSGLRQGGFGESLTGSRAEMVEQANEGHNTVMSELHSTLNDPNLQLSQDLKNAIRRKITSGSREAFADQSGTAANQSAKYENYANSARAVRNTGIAAGLGVSAVMTGGATLAGASTILAGTGTLGTAAGVMAGGAVTGGLGATAYSLGRDELGVAAEAALNGSPDQSFAQNLGAEQGKQNNAITQRALEANVAGMKFGPALPLAMTPVGQAAIAGLASYGGAKALTGAIEHGQAAYQGGREAQGLHDQSVAASRAGDTATADRLQREAFARGQSANSELIQAGLKGLDAGSTLFGAKQVLDKAGIRHARQTPVGQPITGTSQQLIREDGTPHIGTENVPAPKYDGPIRTNYTGRGTIDNATRPDGLSTPLAQRQQRIEYDPQTNGSSNSQIDASQKVGNGSYDRRVTTYGSGSTSNNPQQISIAKREYGANGEITSGNNQTRQENGTIRNVTKNPDGTIIATGLQKDGTTKQRAFGNKNNPDQNLYNSDTAMAREVNSQFSSAYKSPLVYRNEKYDPNTGSLKQTTLGLQNGAEVQRSKGTISNREELTSIDGGRFVRAKNGEELSFESEKRGQQKRESISPNSYSRVSSDRTGNKESYRRHEDEYRGTVQESSRTKVDPRNPQNIRESREYSDSLDKNKIISKQQNGQEASSLSIKGTKEYDKKNDVEYWDKRISYRSTDPQKGNKNYEKTIDGRTGESIATTTRAYPDGTRIERNTIQTPDGTRTRKVTRVNPDSKEQTHETVTGPGQVMPRLPQDLLKKPQTTESSPLPPHLKQATQSKETLRPIEKRALTPEEAAHISPQQKVEKKDSAR